MDIRQLNYFVQVADCGNYSLASQKLFVSQPALSKTIKNMEEELGFTFFYTYQRRQHLTDAGKIFYDKAIKLLKEYDELMEISYDEAGIDKGHINIGLSTAAGPALFSHIYPLFRKQYPLIDFTLTENDTDVLKEDVLKKSIDLAIIDVTFIHEEDQDLFDIYELVRSDIVMVASVDNPLSRYESIKYTDLNGKDLILYNKNPSNVGPLSSEFKRANSKPNVVFSSSQWHLIFELVAADIGIVIPPYYIYDTLKNDKITAVPLAEDGGKRSIALISKKDENRSRACRTFINFATDISMYDGVSQRLYKS